MGLDIPQIEQTVFPSGPAAPYQQLDPSVAAFGARRGQALGYLGQQVGQLGDVLAQHAVQFQAIDNETYAKQADATFLEQAGKVEGEYYATGGQAAMEGYKGFAAKMQALRQSALSTLPNDAARRLLDGVLAPRIGSSLAAGSRHAAEQRSVWIGQASEARAQAAIDDSAFRWTDPVAALKSMAILRGEARAQGALKGWSPEMTADREKQYVSAMWKARLLRQSESDPQGALDIYKAHVGELDAQTQVEVGHTLEADMDRALNRTLAIEARQDAKAEKRIKTQGDDMARYGYTLFNQGSLTREFIEGATPFMEPAEVKGMYELLNKDPNTPTVDNPQALASLEDSLAAGDPIAQQAFQYLQNNEITGATYTSYMNKSRAELSDASAPSAYKQGAQYIHQSLDPGILGSPEAAAIYAGARAQALQEWDNWIGQNPNPSIADAQVEARRVVQSYSIIGEPTVISLGTPMYYQGNAQGLKNGLPEASVALEAAAKQTLDALAAGTLSKAQAAAEIQKIQDWRKVIAKQAEFRSLPKGTQ